FQILIYIIIAISFISSFFKKKKRVQPPTDDLQSGKLIQMDEQVIEPPPSPKQKAEDFNIMKEFESFFNIEESSTPTTKKTEPVHDDKQVYEGVKNRENYIEVPEDSFHKRTTSEHTFINPWEVKKKEIERRKKSITPEIEERVSAYKESLIKKESAAKEIIQNIKNRIQNPATLKEYIIISEIIGKPKALRG
ncbi:hypothetical protein ACFLSS_04665, partial [Bacteroidota bacterium]